MVVWNGSCFMFMLLRQLITRKAEVINKDDIVRKYAIEQNKCLKLGL
jgi:hypothetical protein